VPTFENLYATHVDFVSATVRRYGVQTEAVADVVQEVFMVAHSRLHTLEQPELARSWLHGISRRVSSGHRRKRVGGQLTLDVPIDQIADPSELVTPADLVEQGERLHHLSRLIDTIEPLKREVFVLFELEELSCPEIAKALHIPLNTVYSRLHRARGAFELALALRNGSGDHA
jgi:RNA polymerase sigma-70 factor, ECF subfamily